MNLYSLGGLPLWCSAVCALLGALVYTHASGGDEDWLMSCPKLAQHNGSLTAMLCHRNMLCGYACSLHQVVPPAEGTEGHDATASTTLSLTALTTVSTGSAR